VHDALYASGAEDPYSRRLLRLHENVWDTLGEFDGRREAAIVYHDSVIVGGFFNTIGSDSIQAVACYFDGNWAPYGNFGGNTAGVVYGFRIIQDTLYALGAFGMLDGQNCNGLAKRVGNHWEPVGSFPEFFSPPTFFDAVEYQGKLVVAGNFTSVDGTINDIMAYDGTSWQPLTDCMSGGMNGAYCLAVYQGDLYMGGRYYYGPGTPGQGLMRYDGSQWHMVGAPGGGLQIYNNSDFYPPTVNDMEVRDGLLLVGGSFFYADHLPTWCTASWDGSQWCRIGGYMEDGVSALEFYHDTLYIGCSTIVDYQYVHGLARFIGSSYQVLCSTVGVEEQAEAAPLQVLAEGPGLFRLGNLPDGLHQLRIYDARGRLVANRQVRSMAGRTEAVQVDLGSALYLLRVDGAGTVKYVPLE
jgi:hypothetical protein